MAKFCSNCGKALTAGQKFCVECGTKIEDAPSQAGDAASGAAVGVAGVAAGAQTFNTTASMYQTPEPPMNQAPNPAPGQAPSQTMQSPVGQGNAQGAQQNGVFDIPAPGEPPIGQAPQYQAPQFGAQQGVGGQQFGAPLGGFAAGVYVPDEGIKEMFFRYDNRLNRKPYFIRKLILLVVVIILCGIGGMMAGSDSAGATVGTIIGFIGGLAGIFLEIRRLHDLGKSGWWAIAGCIPLVNFIYGLFLLFLPGTIGPNEYGPDPLGR